MTKIPPPPDGFILVTSADGSDIPPPPEGFVIEGQEPPATSQIDDYYSSGIYAGQYNPLGAIARSLDAGVTAGGDAMTFGWGDEAIGLASTEARDVARQRQEALRESNPVASTVGSISGGVALGTALSPASFTAQMTSRATPLIGRIAAGFADGAVTGGLYGLGSGTDVGSRVMEGLKGAAFGGGIGGSLPIISDTIGAGVRGFRDWRNAGQVAKQVGADPDSLRLLGSIMDADGSLGPQGQANMARAGNEAMLVDAGPNARQLLDHTIQRGGPGTVTAQNAIDERVAREVKAFGQILDSSLGTPQGIGTAQNVIGDAARPQVKQAYQMAYNSPIDYASPAGRKVADIINRIPDRIAGRAVRDAVDQMIYDGIPHAQIMAKIADDGSVSFQGMPNVMQADYIKRALNNIVQDGTDAITGKLTSEAAFASRMARDLRDAVSEAVPNYRMALNMASDPLSQQSAVRLGARLNSMTRDEFGRAVHGMTKPDKEAVLQGFRSRLDDQMAAITKAITDGDVDAREAIKGLKELSSRRTRENLQAVMPEEKLKGLFNSLDRIASTFEIRASVAQNTKTATRLAAERMVDERTGLGMLGHAARGEPLNAGKRIAQNLTGFTDDYLRGLKDQTYADLADLLTRRGGPGQGVYDAIGKMGQTDQATQLMTGRLADLLSAPRVAYPSNLLLDDPILGR